MTALNYKVKFVFLALVLLSSAENHDKMTESAPKVKSLLHDVDVNYQPAARDADTNDDFEVELFYPPEGARVTVDKSSVAPNPVKRLWGVGDTQAYVGRLFRYSIPGDAFQGDIRNYKVKDLPAWAWYDHDAGVIEGVPAAGDKGHNYITVRAKGVDGSSAKDVFSVHIMDVPVSVLNGEGMCSGNGLDQPAGELSSREPRSLTVASIVLNLNLKNLKPAEGTRLIGSTAKNLKIPEERISLVSAQQNYDPLSDDSALTAGPGSWKTPDRISTSSRGATTLIRFTVGCGGTVDPASQATIDKLEELCSSGILEENLGFPVIGWIVNKLVTQSGRMRRSTDSDFEGSGDDYYDDYYDVDDADYLDHRPPQSRVIPTLYSPTYGIPASVYPGSYPAGEDLERPSYVTQSFKPVLHSTPVMVPNKPSRHFTLEASPIYPQASEVPQFGLESSILLFPTAPTGGAVPTAPLTTSHATNVPTAPSLPLEPTVVPNVAVTEYGLKNSPPVVRNRIEKMSWITGTYYRYKIPEDMFEDLEDGNTRKLMLVLKGQMGTDIGVNSWIQLDPVNQEIYALPLDDHIKRWTFSLIAFDSGKKNVSDTIHIHVRQPTKVRNYHHKFSATFKLEKKSEYEFKYALDWQVAVVEKIAALYNSTTDTINVRSVGENPYKMSWTNITLIDPTSNVCPTQALRTVAEVLLDNGSHTPKKSIKEAFLPEFHLKRLHGHFTRPCSDVVQKSSGKPTQENVDQPEYKNYRPEFRNQIDHLEFTVGKFTRRQIPDNTCYDLEDGNSRGLKVHLLTSDLGRIPADSWLQFETTNQEFYGVPLSSDAGTKEYFLECLDRNGAKASDALTVTVQPSDYPSPAPVIFTIRVGGNYQEFLQDGRRKALLVERISSAFGDRDTSSVRIRSFAAGSIVVTWFNASLPSSPCPSDAVQALRQVMQDDDGKLRPDFVRKFSPDFRVLGASVNPSGECLAGGTPTHPREPDVPLPAPTREADKSPATTPHDSEEDYLLTFIVPAVIIALMLVIAALIACCLYRRRRYGKMTMADDRTFVSKGIPIIFAEELDDQSHPPHGADPAKPPVIMKEEKPPLPPPEYHQRGGSTPPGSGDRRGASTEDAPYQPPPPFTNNPQGRNPRPNMPPAYRKPPTYVPP